MDRDCCIDCSSPISTKILSKIGNCDPLSAGTGRPDSAMSESKPAVFKLTVFPPVFGPVISIARGVGTVEFVIAPR